MSRRRKRHEEEENQERWLLTYADMITLLVAFFMMMYSMSILNLEKFKQAAIGIRSGFNGQALRAQPSGDSILEKGSKPDLVPDERVLLPPPFDPKLKSADQPLSRTRINPGPPQPSPRARRVGELTDKIRRSLLEKGIAGNKAARVVAERTGVAIELMGDLIFFPRASAQLSPEAKKILQTVAGILGALPNEITVEGHTSRFEGGRESGFGDSWELSTARASAVVKFLLGSGPIHPERVAVTGYGQYRPTGIQKQLPNPNNNDLVRVFIYQD